jgi:hypothetical protein
MTRMSVYAYHHLEGARVEEVAYQHAGRVAEQRIGGIMAPAHVRAVDDIVVQQCCGVDELHDSGHLVVVYALISECLGGQHHQGGTQTLSAAMDDVFGNLSYQRDFGVQARTDDPIHLRHVIDQKRLKLGLGHVYAW